jgi:catechol 2,3-dioxygenase-like lactoylglutathione lyase family enzyme
MLFQGVDRVLAIVDDIDRAKAFFSDLLGVSFDRTIIDENVQLEVSMSRFGLELASPMIEKHPIVNDRAGYDAHGGILRIIVIRVSDFDQAVAHFKERGVEPTQMLTIGGAREAVYDPSDTYGVPIVLNEYPDLHGMTPQALADPTLSSRG